jgi:DNA-directed RNA polymerase subunit F
MTSNNSATADEMLENSRRDFSQKISNRLGNFSPYTLTANDVLEELYRFVVLTGRENRRLKDQIKELEESAKAHERQLRNIMPDRSDDI